MPEGNAESALQTRESVQMYELMSEHENARASVQMHVRRDANKDQIRRVKTIFSIF